MAELICRSQEENPDLFAVITITDPDGTMELSDLSRSPIVQIIETGSAEPKLPVGFTPDLIIWSGGFENIHTTIRAVDNGASIILMDIAAPPANRLGLIHRPAGLRAVLQHSYMLYAQDSNAVDWLVSQNVPRTRIARLGPLRPGVAISACDEEALSDYASLTNARPIWLCSNFDSRDRNTVLAAHREAARTSHRLLLVLTPAKMGDGPDIATWCESEGYKAGCHSMGASPTDEIQIFVADDPADSDLWFRLAAISFIGGSFTGIADDNPFRPAALGSVVVHGPNPGKRRHLFDLLSSAHGSVALSDPAELGQTIKRLLSPHNAAERAHSAWQVTSAGADLIDALSQNVMDVMDQSKANS